MNHSLSTRFVQPQPEEEVSGGQQYPPAQGSLAAVLNTARMVLKSVDDFEHYSHTMETWRQVRRREEHDLSKAIREETKAANATPKSAAEFAEEEKQKEIREAEKEAEIVKRFSQLSLDLEKQGYSPEDAARMAQESYLAFKHRNMDSE